MLYVEALERLQARGAELAGPRRKFELEHMRVLAATLGGPQRQFSSVLIAGTNGKGSTAATLGSILAESGYRTGLYTSPHLVRVNERIRMSDGSGLLADITDEAFARVFTRVEDVAAGLVREGRLPQLPSYFETVTAMAFVAFAEAGVEIAVLEVGLGGRLDATNIVEPVVSVITDIALDHTEWLGGTLGEIAREKAGILRQGGVMITLPQHPEANAAIGERAVALEVTGVNAADYLPQRSPHERDGGEAYAVPAFGTELALVPVLAGEHQRRNLALALAAAEWLQVRAGFGRISAETVTAGVREVRWPGRLERGRMPGGAALLVDVAHNPAGIWTLRSYLSRAFEGPSKVDGLPGPRVLVFSALADKAVKEMAQVLFPVFDIDGDEARDEVVLVPVSNPRSMKAEGLRELAASHAGSAVRVAGSVAEVFAELRERWQGSVVVAGSVYLVGEWMRAMAEGQRHGE